MFLVTSFSCVGDQIKAIKQKKMNKNGLCLLKLLQAGKSPPTPAALARNRSRRKGIRGAR